MATPTTRTSHATDHGPVSHQSDRDADLRGRSAPRVRRGDNRLPAPDLPPSNAAAARAGMASVFDLQTAETLAVAAPAPGRGEPDIHAAARLQAAFGNGAAARALAPAPAAGRSPGAYPAAISPTTATGGDSPVGPRYAPAPSEEGGDVDQAVGDDGPGAAASLEARPGAEGPSAATSAESPVAGRASSLAPGKAGGRPGDPTGAAPSPTGPTPAAGAGAAPGRSSRVAFEAFTRATATQIARGLPGLGDELAGAFAADRVAVAETTAPIRVVVPGPAVAPDPAAGPAPPVEIPGVEAAVAALPADAGASAEAELAVPPQPEGEAVATDAGPRPRFEPTAGADPGHVDAVSSQARDTARTARESIAGELAANRSGERIVPVGVDRSEPLLLPEATASVGTEASDAMRDYLATAVPANVRAIADADFAPILDASLAPGRKAVNRASLARDRDQDQALHDARAEAGAASEQARSEQDAAIAAGRKQVEAEKQQGIDEGRDRVAAFDRDVEAQRNSKLDEIHTRIATDQQAADATVDNAEAEARQAEQKARDDEAAARQEAENNKPKKKKKKWHEKVGDWFKNAIKRWADALTSAVKSIFRAVKETVNRVLTAAKQAAVGIIRGLRTFVVGAIRAFAASVKLLVAPLLVFFPELRKRVNAAIDGAVDAATTVVNKVAEGLEAAVVAIVDRVQSAVNRVIDTFELVVVTQIALAQALLSGNFLEAAKILFLAACKAVGIPGEEFLGILADAGHALLDIMKRPASFLGNLLKSLGQGLGKFLSHFPQRLIGGLTGWLFGNLAAGGIALPRSFDLKSIFMLIVQVLGFTYEYVRERVVRRLGEKAVATIEKVLTPIRILFTEGPGALWHWLQDQAEQAKNAILAAASQWLITQIITQAAIKLATMFTPVGAFVQAVLMMYNTIMFFVERIKEIFAWVKSITASLKTIAQGAIGAAADAIDRALAQSIPLIIAFFARLLGIGGIGDRIRAVVTKLRAPIDKAIDFVVGKLIDGAKAVWGGIKAGAKKVADWWRARVSISTKRRETHTLFYESYNGEYRLMVASEKRPFDEALQDAKDQADSGDIAKLEKRREAVRRAEQSGEQVQDQVEALGDDLKSPAKKSGTAPGTRTASAGGTDPSELTLLDYIIPHHTGLTSQGRAINGDDPIARDQAELAQEAVIGTAGLGLPLGGAASAAMDVLIASGIVGPAAGALGSVGAGAKAVSLVGNELSLASGALRAATRAGLVFYLENPVLVNEIGLFTAETLIWVEGDVKGLLDAARNDPSVSMQLFLQIWAMKLHIQLANGDTRTATLKMKPARSSDQLDPRRLRLNVEEVEVKSSQTTGIEGSNKPTIGISTGLDSGGGETPRSIWGSRSPKWLKRQNWSKPYSFSQLSTDEARKVIPTDVGCYVFVDSQGVIRTGKAEQGLRHRIAWHVRDALKKNPNGTPEDIFIQWTVYKNPPLLEEALNQFYKAPMDKRIEAPSFKGQKGGAEAMLFNDFEDEYNRDL